MCATPTRHSTAMTNTAPDAMTINLDIFAEIDLNLMVTFLVIYRERNLTRSAAKLRVGQPAVSGALARLRVHFDDALFVRAGFGVAPTAKAEHIAHHLLPAMKIIESVLAQPRFQGSDDTLPFPTAAVTGQ